MGDNINQVFDFKVSDSSENFSTWINRQYIPQDLRGTLQDVNILFVPYENFRDQKIPVFAHKTEEIFHFFQEHAPAGVNVNVCIADDDYKEIALHSDLIIIGGIIVSAVVLPVFVNLLSEYLKRKLFKSPNSKIRIVLTVVDSTSGAKQFEYEGPADSFGKAVSEIQCQGKNSQ